MQVDVGEDCLAANTHRRDMRTMRIERLNRTSRTNDDFALVVDADVIDHSCLDIREYEFRQRYVYDLDIPEAEDPEYLTDWGFSVRSRSKKQGTS